MTKKKIDNFVIFLDKNLGEGSFGKVYMGQQDNTHQKVAIKMLDKKQIDRDNYTKKSLESEINILKTLNSQNIVGFYQVMESSNYYYIIQQYCDGGDMRKLLKIRQKIPQKEAIQILKQICSGFVEILKEGIIHRDLKPQNILINKGVYKICDFGFSKKIHSKNFKNTTIIGTPLYMAIQILKGQSYTTKCDIWALGLIFYQLIHGITPWVAKSEYDLIKNIETKPINFLVEVSPMTKDFLTKCLKIYQKERISWDELLRHPIFQGKYSKYIQLQHQFENKLKFIMNQIRMRIQQQNIDLERLFTNMGYTKETQLNFDHFEQFLKTIDSSLTSEQQRYIFEKLDTDESDTISFEQLQTEMINNKVPMKSKIMNYHKKVSHNIDSQQSNNNKLEETKNIRQNLQIKLIKAFISLSEKIRKNNISLHQVFVAYDVNQHGDLSFQSISKILKKLDQSFSQTDLEMAFQMIDLEGNGKLTFQQFYKYYCKATGQPIKNYMRVRYIEKQDKPIQNIEVNNKNKKIIKVIGSSKV